jgi:copper(I)-binding protein
MSACQEAARAPLIAGNVEVTTPFPGQRNSAVYLTLQNTTRQSIVVTSVSSAEYGSVEIHETRVAGGIARMHKLSELTIPARSTIAFARGGMHLMLMQPDKDIESVTLTFYANDTPLLSVVAPVSQGSQ